jgi:hypothetical protein
MRLGILFILGATMIFCMIGCAGEPCTLLAEETCAAHGEDSPICKKRREDPLAGSQKDPSLCGKALFLVRAGETDETNQAD